MAPSPRSAFTLIELLLVIAIMAILAAIAVPLLNSSGNINRAVTGISLSLDQARTYAMGHNTYVWVGFMQPTGTQNLTVGMVAGTTGEAVDITKSTYVPIARLQTYPNFSLTSVANVQNSNSSMVGLWSNGTELLGTSPTPLHSFQITANGNPVTFPSGSILQFSPRGEASVSSTGDLPHWIQFGLQPLQGGQKNVAAIQIAGLSGQVQVFRP